MRTFVSKHFIRRFAYDKYVSLYTTAYVYGEMLRL